MLRHHRVRWISMFAIITCSLASPPEVGAQGEPTCVSGGVGSTGCSLEAAGISCSVTCAEGYYACCNLGCRCVAINEQ